MLIKEAVHENCKECGRFKREISPEQHGCDECRSPIVPCGNDERLEVVVFHNDSRESTEQFYFCSWACVFRFVKRIKTDNFFTLPYVVADHKIKGRRAQDFQALIKRLPLPRR